jgi:hypothetical protein
VHGGEELQQSSKLSMVSLESTCGNVLDYTVSFYLLQFSLVKELCVDRKDGSLASRLFDCWMFLFTVRRGKASIIKKNTLDCEP